VKLSAWSKEHEVAGSNPFGGINLLAFRENMHYLLGSTVSRHLRYLAPIRCRARHSRGAVDQR
jgi:hypothetical protein